MSAHRLAVRGAFVLCVTPGQSNPGNNCKSPGKRVYFSRHTETRKSAPREDFCFFPLDS